MNIEVENLFHDYEGKGNYAVYDLSFSIPEGSIFGFLGPSGAGKSTVQNLMTGLLPLQRGTIFYDGKSVGRLNRDFFNKVGYSFELPNVYAKLTGLENLKYYAGLFSVPTRDPMQLLEMVGLADAAHRRAGKYSKGMKQRLLFARSLINDGEILFLDEPMSGLDPTTASRIKEMIKDQRRAGKTIFLTTHNMYAADELCDEVAFLHEGKTIAKDTPRNLKLSYGERSVEVEFESNGGTETTRLFLEREEDRARLNGLVNDGSVVTMHSQEATLEDIFIRLTGRSLS